MKNTQAQFNLSLFEIPKTQQRASSQRLATSARAEKSKT
jgi:hypothetical protein